LIIFAVQREKIVTTRSTIKTVSKKGDGMTNTLSSPETAAAVPAKRDKGVFGIGIAVLVLGIVFFLAGGGTWLVVESQLKDQNITVAEDASRFAGQEVRGPLTAYAEAEIIQEHALKATGGKTYAEMEREDPARATMMNASFLRASLFTSIVAFGVALMSIGVGITFVLLGIAAMRSGRAKKDPAPTEVQLA
jgi:hypothetical protein